MPSSARYYSKCKGRSSFETLVFVELQRRTPQGTVILNISFFCYFLISARPKALLDHITR
jgi:hypothetical protein